MFGFSTKREKAEITKVDYVHKYRLAACDITSNCNLRCKFCFNCFDQKNIPMTQEILEKVLKVLPFVSDTSYENNSGFYFSCLWEPSIHPQFIDFLELLPDMGKEKIFFTTNFAKAQNEEFFDRLKKCNIHHINVSIETLDRERYHAITQGTDFFYDNFFANLEKLSDSFSQDINAPKIRYISMAIKSNMDELAEVIKVCHEKYHAYLSEVRTPFVGQYLLSFQDELLSREEIVSLETELNALPYDVSCYLEFQDASTVAGHGLPSGGTQPDVVTYKQVKEDYYDIRLNSDGMVRWNANQEEIFYDESIAYEQLFEDKLIALSIEEVRMNQITDADVLSKIKNARAINRNVHIHIDSMQYDGRIWKINGWAGADGVDTATLTPVMVCDHGKKAVAYVCKKVQRDDVAGVFGEEYRQAGFQVLIEEKEAELLQNAKVNIYWYSVEKKSFVVKNGRNFVVENNTVSWQV